MSSAADAGPGATRQPQTGVAPTAADAAGPAVQHDVVFLLDVDNTLLDNDAIIADLHGHLADAFGAASAAAYWSHIEALRSELGYVDYLGALQRYRDNAAEDDGSAHRLLSMASFLIDYPFAQRLYPRALQVVAELSQLAPTVILSDGDVVFQPRKVQRSGLWDAVQGRVMIFVHKEQMLDAVQRAWPARRYVMVDDKERILHAMKQVLGERLLTVFPRQGHYAHDPANAGRYPAWDCTVDRIGDFTPTTAAALLQAPPACPT